jgi:hypothetical protein
MRFAAHIIQSKQHTLLQLQLHPLLQDQLVLRHSTAWWSGAWVSSSDSSRNPLPTIHHLSPSTVSRRASSSSCRTQSKIAWFRRSCPSCLSSKHWTNYIHKVWTSHCTTRAVNSVSSSMASTTAGSPIKS